MATKPDKALLDRLGSPRAELHETALGELRDVTVDRFASLAREHREGGARLALTTLTVVLSILFLLASVLGGQHQGLAHTLRLAGLFTIIPAGTYLEARWRRHNGVGQLLSNARMERIELGGHTGFQQLSAVLDLLYDASAQNQNGNLYLFKGICRDKRVMMIRELYSLTADEAILISDNQRLMLRSWIGLPSGFFDYNNTDLGLAAMDALAKANDVQTFGQVKRLAAEPPITPNMKRVREAATAHLRTMQDRRVEQEREATLLRASSEPNEPQVLLTPAHSPGTTPGDQLLRPK